MGTRWAHAQGSIFKAKDGCGDRDGEGYRDRMLTGLMYVLRPAPKPHSNLSRLAQANTSTPCRTNTGHLHGCKSCRCPADALRITTFSLQLVGEVHS